MALAADAFSVSAAHFSVGRNAGLLRDWTLTGRAREAGKALASATHAFPVAATQFPGDGEGKWIIDFLSSNQCHPATKPVMSGTVEIVAFAELARDDFYKKK
jgi:hypothetical protein